MKLRPLKVSQVNNYISRIINSDPVLSNIKVTGEISNIKYHGSGYIFFTLKDDTSRLNCFVSKENSRYIKYILDNGMEVIADGYIHVYERHGNYTLNITDIVLQGQGNLNLAFEKLKEKLKAKGYFDPLKKKPLPGFPEKIALVTAETGAAIKDMIKVIQDKNRFVEIFLFPSLVQGEYAAQDLASHIDLINKKYPDMDIIIIGRGGGSMEELWAFNEEVLADSIYWSVIPVISAVGHETDYSIADFVADARAATPTKAAEMAVPDLHQLGQKLISAMKDIQLFTKRNMAQAESILDRKGIETMQSAFYEKLDKADRKIQEYREQFVQQTHNKIKEYDNRLNLSKNDLENLNPEAIFKRGYSVVFNQKNQIIQSIDAIDIGNHINIMLTDGELEAVIEKKRKSQQSELYLKMEED